MGKWSQIGRKISSFQPIFKDNQPLLNLRKTSLIQAIFRFNFSIHSQRFIRSTTDEKRVRFIISPSSTDKIKIPITQRVTGIYMIESSINYLFKAKATFTAQATVHPTIGLLPIPRNPIIST